jgi:hypothetical protein
VLYGEAADDSTVTLAAYNTGLNAITFRQATRVGTKVDSKEYYHKARLVAGGFRLSKTSRSDNEGGVIKAIYAQRGSYVEKSLKSLVEDIPFSKTHAKVSVVEGCDAYGKSNYLLGGTYRPKDIAETELYHDRD